MKMPSSKITYNSPNEFQPNCPLNYFEQWQSSFFCPSPMCSWICSSGFSEPIKPIRHPIVIWHSKRAWKKSGISLVVTPHTIITFWYWGTPPGLVGKSSVHYIHFLSIKKTSCIQFFTAYRCVLFTNCFDQHCGLLSSVQGAHMYRAEPAKFRTCAKL
jgi:hypothetical protein